MTLMKRRGLRALGTLCAASAILAAVPAGTAFAADPYPTPSPTPKGDPKIIEALQNAPELKGATFDVSGVTLRTGKAKATNESWTPDDYIFYDHDYDNPIRKMPEGEVQQPEPFNSISASKAHWDTYTSTRTHDFSFGITTGFSYSTAVEVGIDSTSSTSTKTYKAEFNFTYKYGMQETVTKSDVRTINSTGQTMMVSPDYNGRIRQWVDIGTYEADMTVPGTLSGDVIITKCGAPVRVPIGRLAAMKRDDDQGPLFPDTSTDGDVLQQSATIHWKAYIAAKAHTEKVWTSLTDGTSTSTITDDSPAPTAAKSSPAPAVLSSPAPTTTAEAGEERNLRSIVPCSTPSDLNTSGGSPREWAATGPGTIAVGNHTYLKADKTLINADTVVDRNVQNAVGGWNSRGGEDWVAYVRADGRAYSRLLNGSPSQYDRTFPLGTRAVGYHTYLTPAGDLYYASRRIAQHVTSATGGLAWSDWVTYVSDGKGYTWASYFTTGPLEDGSRPSGTTAVGMRSYLTPDGVLSYEDTVVATGVTSALGGIGSGSGNNSHWLTFIADNRGHSWSTNGRTIRDEVWLGDDAKAVGNHTYLDTDGFLYFLDNEVAQNVTSAVGGWGSGPDWASYVRVGS